MLNQVATQRITRSVWRKNANERKQAPDGRTIVRMPKGTFETNLLPGVTSIVRKETINRHGWAGRHAPTLSGFFFWYCDVVGNLPGIYYHRLLNEMAREYCRLVIHETMHMGIIECCRQDCNIDITSTGKITPFVQLNKLEFEHHCHILNGLLPSFVRIHEYEQSRPLVHAQIGKDPESIVFSYLYQACACPIETDVLTVKSNTGL